MSLYLRVMVGVFCMLMGGISAWAEQHDTRMRIWVAAEGETRLSVPKAIAQALPILWDRVLLQSSRHMVSDRMNATLFLSRAAPEAAGVWIEFNPTRVWQYLEQKQIPFIRRPLHARLLVQMLNQNGVHMPESAALLQQYADEIAMTSGIVLDATAPSLVLSWRWLDDAQFNLTVRGHPKVPESSEIRAFMAGDPQIQLQAWLQETLLKARDAAVLQVLVEPEILAVRDLPLKRLLTIERQAALPEQITLEDALRKHPKVVALIPKYLGVNSQQYVLQLKDKDFAWVKAWLASYGLQTTTTTYGWLAQ